MTFRTLASCRWPHLAIAVSALCSCVWWGAGLRAAAETPVVEKVADTGWRESSKGIVAGGWATISGRRLGAGSVAGVAVEIGGKLAVLQAARTSPEGDELDLIVPRLASGTAPLVVTTAEGASAPFSVSVREFQPSLFSVEAGEERHADALTLDGLERIGPFDLSGRQEGEPGSRPAAPLEKISLFVNGCGLWTDRARAGYRGQGGPGLSSWRDRCRSAARPLKFCSPAPLLDGQASAVWISRCPYWRREPTRWCWNSAARKRKPGYGWR